MLAEVLAPPVQMTLDEFILLYDTEGPFEFVNGEIIKLMPTVSVHNEISKKITFPLYIYEQQGVGVVVYEAPFVMLDLPNWVKGSRVPDVMFYLQARVDAYKAQTPDWQDKPYILVPDLAVEIISKNDRYDDIEEKVAGYLEDGVKQIWVVNPRRKSVTVYTPTEAPRFLNTEAILTGGDLLPDFAVPVKSLFP